MAAPSWCHHRRGGRKVRVQAHRAGEYAPRRAAPPARTDMISRAAHAPSKGRLPRGHAVRQRAPRCVERLLPRRSLNDSGLCEGVKAADLAHALVLHTAVSARNTIVPVPHTLPQARVARCCCALPPADQVGILDGSSHTGTRCVRPCTAWCSHGSPARARRPARRQAQTCVCAGSWRESTALWARGVRRR
jgi:hypothetical protein